MSSSIHLALKSWDKSCNWAYLGSVLVVNKNVPLFEEEIGRHDYDWVLKITEHRKCMEVRPCVIRYVSEHNLSMNPQYRKDDYELMLKLLKQNKEWAGIKRLNATRAKYFYKTQNYKEARKYFKKSTICLKNIMYYFTSFSPVLARWVVKKFNVFG